MCQEPVFTARMCPVWCLFAKSSWPPNELLLSRLWTHNPLYTWKQQVRQMVSLRCNDTNGKGRLILPLRHLFLFSVTYRHTKSWYWTARVNASYFPWPIGTLEADIRQQHTFPPQLQKEPHTHFYRWAGALLPAGFQLTAFTMNVPDDYVAVMSRRHICTATEICYFSPSTPTPNKYNFPNSRKTKDLFRTE